MYFEGRGRAPPFSDYLSISPIALLRLGRKSQVSSGHLPLTPPQNPSGTHKNRACRVSLASVPCQQHPCSQQQQEQQGFAPALPHLPAPRSAAPRSVFSNNTAFFSAAIINICTAQALLVRHKTPPGAAVERAEATSCSVPLFLTSDLCSQRQDGVPTR